MGIEQSKRSPEGKRLPKRYKLYDRIPLSLNSVNVIIYVLVGLIVLAVLVGTFVR